MRLFIAIPLPDSVIQQLIDLQQPIDGVRWQNHNQFHITLKFLGETDPGRVPHLMQSLDNIDLPVFSITLSGFGYFPEGKQPRVLWTAIKRNESLVKLHKAVEEVCTGLGFETENRPFKPHITIARVDGTPKRDVMSFIDQYKKFSIPGVTVDEFVLYESKLHREGAKYIRKNTIKLVE
jgi:2'-5' RNA ligase